MVLAAVTFAAGCCWGGLQVSRLLVGLPEPVPGRGSSEETLRATWSIGSVKSTQCYRPKTVARLVCFLRHQEWTEKSCKVSRHREGWSIATGNTPQLCTDPSFLLQSSSLCLFCLPGRQFQGQYLAHKLHPLSNHILGGAWLYRCSNWYYRELTVDFSYNESVLETSWHLILLLCFYISLWYAQVWMLNIQ